MPPISTGVRFVLLLAVAQFAMACDGSVAAPTRCNADIDCAMTEVCRDGVCVEGSGPSPEGTPQPGTPEPGTPEPGTPEPGTPEPGTPEPGTPEPEPGVSPDAGPTDGGPLPDGGLTDAGPQSQWWDRKFGARRQLEITVPDGVVETLVDVPVQIRLSRNDVPDARDDFGDVRFVSADHVPLAFEREGAADDGASFWVRIPEIGPDAPVTAYLYFQNPDAEPLPYNPDVWTNGYAGVWHFAAESLSEPLQNRAEYKERSASLNRGADALEGVEGGLDLDGSNDSVTLDRTTDLAHAADVVTLSARINSTLGQDDLQVVVGISVGDDFPGDRSRASLAVGSDGDIQMYGRRQDAEDYVDQRSATNPVQANTWHHLSGTLDYTAGTVKAYVDGELVLDATQEFSNEPPDTFAHEIVVGAEDDQLGSHFRGLLDEVRISTVVRSQSWVAFEAAMLADDVRTLGEVETQPRDLEGAAPVATDDVLSLSEDADTVTISLFENDLAEDESALYLVSVPESNLGRLVVTPDRLSVTFDPDSNANGTEEHTVVIADGRNGRAEATLRIDLESINDIPIARFDHFAMRPGEVMHVDVRENDDDIETSRLDLQVSVDAALPQGVSIGVTDDSVLEIDVATVAALGAFSVPYTLTDADGATASASLFLSLHNAPSSLNFADVSGEAGISREGDPDGVTVVDVNQDGLLDIASIGDDSCRIYHRQDLNGWAYASYFEGPAGRQFSFANVDGEGSLEGILTREMTLFRDTGTTYVADDMAGTVNDNTGSFIWVDADHDGAIDIFSAGGTSPGMSLQFNDGSGIFTQDISAFPSESSDVETSTSADINGDGFQDFVVMATNVRFFVSQPDGSYAEEAANYGLRDEPLSDPYAGIAFGDCDNDGDLDLAMGARGKNEARLYRNVGGTFEREGDFAFKTEIGVGLAWGDVDNDTNIDLFIGGGSDRYATPRRHHGSLMLLNRGDCRFVDASASVGLTQKESPISSAVLADLDKDGDLDLVGNRHAATVGVFENLLTGAPGFRVRVRDISADGKQHEVRGAFVTLTGERLNDSPITMVRQISGGEGNWSLGPSEVHFGLGDVPVSAVSVVVRLPDGRIIESGNVLVQDANDDGPRSLILDSVE